MDKDNLPKGWAVAKLGEICVIQTGKWDANHGTVDGKFRFYTCAFEHYFCTTNRFSGESLILPGNGANVGQVFYYNGEFDAYQRTYVVNNIKIVPKFLFYHFKLNWKKGTDEKQYGSATNYIRIGNFNEYQVQFPPLNEQKRILAKLEQLLTDLDKGIEYLETSKQQLKVYRQAVLKWAFEGKLTNTKFKLVVTGDVIKPINNGYTPTKQFLFQGSGEIPFLKVYNLNFDGTLNFKKDPTFIPKIIHEKELKRSICIPGDVLINIVGPPLGKVSVVTNEFPEWNINQAIVMFRPNEEISSKYLAYFLQNHVTINWLEGTSKATAGQWNVKVSTCREIPFPLCSSQEQKKIVKEIESRLSVCDKIEETIEKSLQQAEALRLSIIKKAFEGKLVPQDPNDEPAEELLARILAAKASSGKPEKKKHKKSNLKEQSTI